MCWYVGVPYNTPSGPRRRLAHAAKSDHNSLTPALALYALTLPAYLRPIIINLFRYIIAPALVCPVPSLPPV